MCKINHVLGIDYDIQTISGINIVCRHSKKPKRWAKVSAEMGGGIFY